MALGSQRNPKNKRELRQKMRGISTTEVRQFTKKQIEIAKKLAEGYSQSDIDHEGIASLRYVAKLRTNPDFNRYVYELLIEFKQSSKDELLLLARQKVKELILSKPKKDLLDYLDFIAKLTGSYAPGEYKFEHKYTEPDVNTRIAELLSEMATVEKESVIIDTRGLKEAN